MSITSSSADDTLRGCTLWARRHKTTTVIPILNYLERSLTKERLLMKMLQLARLQRREAIAQQKSGRPSFHRNSGGTCARYEQIMTPHDGLRENQSQVSGPHCPAWKRLSTRYWKAAKVWTIARKRRLIL